MIILIATDPFAPRQLAHQSKKELQHHWNMIEARNKKQRRKRETICEPCPSVCPYNHTVQNPSLAALNEIIFVDDPDDNEYRHKCTAVIYTQNSVLTSSECVDRFSRPFAMLQVKAGSDVWAAPEATTHSVVNLTPWSQPQIVVLELNVPFPAAPSVGMVKISPKLVEYGMYQMWTWKISDAVPLKYRLKHLPIESEDVRLESNCTHCMTKMCVIERALYPCSEYYHTSGNPLFDDDVLVALQSSLYCLDDIIERCFNPVYKTRFDLTIPSPTTSNETSEESTGVLRNDNIILEDSSTSTETMIPRRQLVLTQLNRRQKPVESTTEWKLNS